MDTSALYALISASDIFHHAASNAYTAMVRARNELWVPSYVLVEFGGLVHSRLGFQALKSFYEAFSGTFRTVWVDNRVHREAWGELERMEGRGLNFVDWVVAVVARELSGNVFTFDSDFARQGVPVVP